MDSSDSLVPALEMQNIMSGNLTNINIVHTNSCYNENVEYILFLNEHFMPKAVHRSFKTHEYFPLEFSYWELG